MDLADDEETLDLFLDKIKKEYKSDWTEENWEEQFEKHPLFMTKLPEPDANGNFPPDIEAIRQLHWDPDHNDPKEIAIKYKEEGNLMFKCNKFKHATESYSEGLKQILADEKTERDKTPEYIAECVELKSILYSNRAAAQFHLKNFRSSLTDSVQARKLNKKNVKPILKGAECCFELKMFNDCMKWCDQGIMLTLQSVENENADVKIKSRENLKKLKELRIKAELAKKTHERDERKKEAGERKKKESQLKLFNFIKSQGIRVQEKEKLFIDMMENPPNPQQKVVSFSNEDFNELNWPVLFLYPEYGQTDFIESFNEHTTFEEHLALMFAMQPEWDTRGDYKPDTIQIYHENRDKHKLVKVKSNQTLLQVLKQEGMIVQLGTPNFVITVKDSPFERIYIEKYNEL